ncbi:MAG: orotidine-5'-phosphate decarboxylase [Gammaproteobacteria bacterium]
MISHLSYSERANYCLSPLAQNLFRLMDAKQTNLTLSVDVTSAAELLTLANDIGPEICVLKTHIDIIDDYTPELTHELLLIAHKHRFLLFEDRKFADIGNTVKYQYKGGIYRIAEWADIINAHGLPGIGIIQGLAEVGRKKNRGLLLIAEMSSRDHLMDAVYKQKTLAMAEQYADFAIGFITQHALSTDPHWINFTPGIQLKNNGDELGQQYKTPEQAILENGADVIIVGRGIIHAADSVAMAVKYREAGWNAYLKRQEG